MQTDFSQAAPDHGARPDGAVLCWIAPPVVRALESAAAGVGALQADAAAVEDVAKSLREARGALYMARVAGAPEVIVAAEQLLAQPGASEPETRALCRQACIAVRDYVSGLCTGLLQRPQTLLALQRTLQLRAGVQPEGGLDEDRAAPAPADVARTQVQRDQLRRVEELWERHAAGDLEALPPCRRALQEVLADGLPHPQLQALGVRVAQALSGVPAPAVALPIAAALLYLQDALAVWPEACPRLDEQTDALGEWLREPTPSKQARARATDLRQDAHRREQARALAARLSAELVGSVRSAQHHMQAFFEEGGGPDALAPAHAVLLQTQRVLTLMGEPAAVRATAFCTRHIGEWQATPDAADAGGKAHVVAAICAVEYYLEQLAFGDVDLGAILRRAGVPDEVYLEPRTAPEAGVGAGGDAAADTTPATEARAPADAGPHSAVPAGPVDTACDPDMLQIFLEEAAEVLRTLGAELEGLRQDQASRERLGVVRRGYHTLKGSGRMVGLTHLGEAAWALEQALNNALQRGDAASDDVLRLLDLAQARFARWVERLGADGRAEVDATTLAQWSEHIRRGEPLPSVVPAEPAAPPVPVEQASVAVPARTVEIGATRLSPGLFSIFVEEAAQHVATLRRELGTFVHGTDGAASYESFRAAHTLAGIAGTTGFATLSELASELERVLQLLHFRPHRLHAAHAAQLTAAAEGLERMVGSVVRLEPPEPASALAAELRALADRLLAESGGVPPLHALLAPASADTGAESACGPEGQAGADVQLDVQEAPPAGDAYAAQAYAIGRAERRRARIDNDLDRDLLPVFLEEASDLLPQIGQLLRDWRNDPGNEAHPQALKRLLHTVKGSARMAGAMALGELTHSIETRVADAAERGSIPEHVFDSLYVSFDRMGVLLEQLERGERDVADGDVQRDEPVQGSAPALLRVRAELVDRLVEEAGEVSIARARMEVDLRAMRGALRDLTESVIRLRGQVREVEIQAETQMESRLAQARQAEEQFDPLEFDRFTRLQELTRFLAESISDVAALQQSILESADHLDATLVTQRRTARAVQDGLMRVRLIPVATLADRLHRVARLTARESGKRVELEIRGGRVELDRGVMERIAGPLEHLLRNAIVHGIEGAERRTAAGKPAAGSVVLDVQQQGNEVTLTLQDDGQGLDLARIRARAAQAGLVSDATRLSDEEAAALIFASGLSTSDHLTEAAGRGIGLDVVRAEIGALGGRVQVDFEPDRGTRFNIFLPVTLSVMQAVLVGCGGQTFALPATTVEQVQKVKQDVLAQSFGAGEVHWQGAVYTLFDLRQLLGGEGGPPAARRYHALALLRSGTARIALYVDELLGSQEIVVKNIGTQLARVAGIAGAAVLGSGESVLILNPIVLTQAAHASPVNGIVAPALAPVAEAPDQAARPSVMVVDDSLTIRRITGRLLARAGYEVVEARDGVDALEKLRAAVPAIVLLDIEMPRMDGFELTRRMRDDPRLRHVPIIVISSRTADKHREHAAQLGVNLYLGKPYQEDELLGHVAAFAAGAPDPATA